MKPGTVEVPTRLLQVEASPQLRSTLQANEDGVLHARFSPDGKTLATSGSGGEVGLWDVAKRERRLTLPREGYAYGLAFAPDGKSLLVSSNQPTDAAGKDLPRDHRGEEQGVRGGVRICDVETGKVLGWLRHERQRAAFGLYVSADGKTAAVVEQAREKGARPATKNSLWDLTNRKHLADVPTEGAVINLSPDGKTLVLQGRNGGVLWDVATAKERASLTQKNEYPGRCVFSRDGTTLVGFLHGPDGIRLAQWDVATGKCLKQWASGAKNARSLALSPDGALLAMGHGTATRAVEPCDVTVWDVKAGRKVLTLHGHVNDVLALDFHPDGTLLVSGGSDGTARLWEVKPEAAASR